MFKSANLRIVAAVCGALALFPASVSVYASGAPVKVIFDTDFAEDVDDVGALAMLHALADAKEVEILACMISARNEAIAPAIDAVNTWYGRPDIPIGNVRGLKIGYPNSVDDKPTPSKYVEPISNTFPHDLKKSSDAPDAVQLYRKILASQPDQSVTIISVGFLRNLKNLLDSPKDESSDLDGEDLVERKVKQWVCMGGIFPEGRFPNGEGEYNVILDTESSVRAINDWPTPVVFSGFEIGEKIQTGAELRHTPENSPVRAGYQHYNGLDHRASWDQTAVLFGVRGARDYWTLSEPGMCVMHARTPEGYNEWIPSSKHQHRYLIQKMPIGEIAKVIEELMVRQPVARNQR